MRIRTYKLWGLAWTRKSPRSAGITIHTPGRRKTQSTRWPTHHIYNITIGHYNARRWHPLTDAIRNNDDNQCTLRSSKQP